MCLLALTFACVRVGVRSVELVCYTSQVWWYIYISVSVSVSVCYLCLTRSRFAHDSDVFVDRRLPLSLLPLFFCFCFFHVLSRASLLCYVCRTLLFPLHPLHPLTSVLLPWDPPPHSRFFFKPWGVGACSRWCMFALVGACWHIH